MTAKANVEVSRNSGENPTNLIRRFTKRVQGSGVLPRVRGIRYHSRPLSKYGRKKKTLVSLERKANFEELTKMGRAPVSTKRRR